MRIKAVCEEYLQGRYELEVIDIYQQPELAKGEQIIATPTLIKKLPSPLRRIVGDLSNKERVLLGLDLREVVRTVVMADATHESEMGDLQRRLDEAEETLRAIRTGEVDALVVEGAEGHRVFTLQGADHPYRTLIEAIHQGAVCLSREGTVLYCNRCFASMVQWPHEKVVGAAVEHFFPPSHRVPFEVMVEGGRTRGVQGELLIQAADGSLLPVYVALAPLPLNEAEALCMVVTDLTDQKKHEDLQQASRRKDEFLATLAHELRNPLAPITNALQILRLSPADAQAIDHAMDVMDRQLQHMVRLVDDLLDVSRITRGKVELRKERIDLAKVVQSAVETSRPLIEGSGHQLTVQLAPEQICLEGDLTRLAQVVSNLLNNRRSLYQAERPHLVDRGDKGGRGASAYATTASASPATCCRTFSRFHSGKPSTGARRRAWHRPKPRARLGRDARRQSGGLQRRPRPRQRVRRPPAAAGEEAERPHCAA